MNTIIYITHHDGKMETRTYCKGNEAHQKELSHLFVKLATNNPYKRVTIERVE